MLFSELPLHPALAEAIARRGFVEATPVQSLMLSAEHRERDLLVSARTGSGKTLAFGLALASELLGERPGFGKAGAPLALVVAPTRELALQVQRELTWLYAATGAKVRACVGGMDLRREQRELALGAHVVVGTPGRLCDHLDRDNLDVSALRVLVLDEADEMLDMGFRDELERILRDAPKERRTLMFSATIPAGIERLAERYQRRAVRVVATPAHEAHEDIEYRAHLVAPREREHAVVNTLRRHEVPGALVFCATREAVTHLQASLAERGFQAVAISGELTQAERVRALTALRDGRARVLVATDVAARGLDLPALDLVIHADLPRDPQGLHHRSGRTGRAGRKGVSVLLVPHRFKGGAERLLRFAKIAAVWSPVATVEEIKALDRERLARDIGELAAQSGEEDLELARTLLERHEALTLVGALVRERRQALPAPEELPETAAMTRPRARPQPSGAQRHPARRQPERAAARPERAAARPERVTPRAERAAPRPERAASRGEERSARDARGEAGNGWSPPRRRERPHEEQSGVWFRINVGREKNADPRWLVPLLCRRGGVVKRDIGQIDILARETRVAIAPDVAGSFAENARRPDRKDPSIRIEPLARHR